MFSSYLRFEPLEIPKGQTTERWSVLNQSGGHLGEVKFSGAWRKYCFFPHGSTQFDNTCLLEIADFIGHHTAKWRNS